jgi:hypothetical protein
MRIRYLPIAVAVLALLAGCVSPLQAGSTDGTAADTTITVSGYGEVTADADLAVVSLSVAATADTADAARAQVATDTEQMRTALRDAGVADDAVTTAAFRISPQYDYAQDRREIIGYEAVHAFHVETAPDRAGTVVDVAVRNGASRVDGVRFTLTDETRESLRAEALSRAMTAARADAETIAAAENLAVEALHTATTVDGPSPVRPMVERSFDAAADPGTVFEPGPVTVTASVTATYTAA